MFPGHLRDRLRRGIWIRGRSVGSSLGNTPPSNNVAPSLARGQLLGRGPGLLSFQGGRGIPGGSLRHLLCKRHPRFFPLYTATIVRCVVTPTATALRLFPRG